MNEPLTSLSFNLGILRALIEEPEVIKELKDLGDEEVI